MRRSHRPAISSAAGAAHAARRRLALTTIILAGAAVVATGCMRPSAANWAQLSPIIKPEPAPSSAVMLGVRGG